MRMALVDRTDVMCAGVAGREAGRRAGLGNAACEELALSVMELAANAVRHGGGGTLELEEQPGAVVVTVTDRGPGMADPARLFEARKRTPQDPPWRMGTSMGAGGAAVKRLMDEVDATSPPSGGLCVRAVKRAVPR